MAIEWKIHERLDQDAPKAALPTHIFTGPAPITSDKIPLELAILLPNRKNDIEWLGTMEPNLFQSNKPCLGLFMSDPFLRIRHIAMTMQNMGFEWITNFPSVSQHEGRFLNHITEVGLGPEYELEQLHDFLEKGIRCIATIATKSDAEMAIEMGFDTLFLIPKVSAFEVGFPSQLSRDNMVRQISDLPRSDHIKILTLAKSSEVASPNLWPRGTCGVVEQGRQLNN